MSLLKRKRSLGYNLIYGDYDPTTGFRARSVMGRQPEQQGYKTWQEAIPRFEKYNDKLNLFKPHGNPMEGGRGAVPISAVYDEYARVQEALKNAGYNFTFTPQDYVTYAYGKTMGDIVGKYEQAKQMYGGQVPERVGKYIAGLGVSSLNPTQIAKGGNPIYAEVQDYISRLNPQQPQATPQIQAPTLSNPRSLFTTPTQQAPAQQAARPSGLLNMIRRREEV